MQQQKKRAVGRNIYLDDKGRDIYYDRISKNGYIITEADMRKFYYYQNRYVLILIAIVLGYNFIASLQTCILIGVVAGVIAEWTFRKKFLPSLTMLVGFKPEKRIPPYQQIAQNDPKNKIILKAVLYMLLAVLLVLNAWIEQLSSALFVLSCLVALVSVYAAVMNLLAIKEVK